MANSRKCIYLYAIVIAIKLEAIRFFPKDLNVKNSKIVAMKQNRETEKNKNIYDPGKNKML